MAFIDAASVKGFVQRELELVPDKKKAWISFGLVATILALTPIDPNHSHAKRAVRPLKEVSMGQYVMRPSRRSRARHRPQVWDMGVPLEKFL